MSQLPQPPRRAGSGPGCWEPGVRLQDGLREEARLQRGGGCALHPQACYLQGRRMEDRRCPFQQGEIGLLGRSRREPAEGKVGLELIWEPQQERDALGKRTIPERNELFFLASPSANSGVLNENESKCEIQIITTKHLEWCRNSAKLLPPFISASLHSHLGGRHHSYC